VVDENLLREDGSRPALAFWGENEVKRRTSGRELRDIAHGRDIKNKATHRGITELAHEPSASIAAIALVDGTFGGHSSRGHAQQPCVRSITCTPRTPSAAGFTSALDELVSAPWQSGARYEILMVVPVDRVCVHRILRQRGRAHQDQGHCAGAGH
jgi:hypothetical protein